MIGRAFRWIWRWALLLPIRGAKVLAWIATIAAALCLAFVLSAQLTRLHSSGDWRAVPFAELLQILHVELPAGGGESVRQGIDFLLGLPATLVLFICAVIFYSIKRLLDIPDRWLLRQGRAAEVNTHDHACEAETDEGLIKDLERALDHSGKWEKS